MKDGVEKSSLREQGNMTEPRALFLPRMDVLKVKRNGSSRFPPKPKLAIPAILTKADFCAEPPKDWGPSGSKKSAVNISSDLQKKMGDMEQLQTGLITLVCENRGVTRSYCTKLSQVASPPSEGDLRRIKTVDLKELQKLLQDTVALVEEVDTTLSRKLPRVLPEDIASGNATLSSWQLSIVNLFTLLRTEASKTEIVVHNLLDLAEDLTTTLVGTSCRLDGIEPDWASLGHFKEGIQTSNKTVCYVAWMEARGLPVCDAIFEFLQAPSEHCNSLTIVGYTFAAREFCEILEFIATNAGRTPLILPVSGSTDTRGGRGDHESVASESLYAALKNSVPLYLSNVVHELVLDECHLNDYDMSTLASHLPALSSLRNLCLRGNNITSAGATTLATCLWDRASELETLRLDRNSIGSDGALSLSKALHRCRYMTALSLSFNPIGDAGLFYIVRALMNPARRARGELPRPFQLSQKDGYDYEDDIESTYSDDEDALHRARRRERDAAGEHDEEDEEWKGEDDHTLSNSQYDSEFTGDAAGYFDDDATNRSFKTSLMFHDDSDVFTMAADNEDVYSIALSRRNSVQMHQSMASMSLMTKLSSKFDPIALSKMPLFLRKFRLIRFKLIAFSAFSRLRSRGHAMYSLSVAGCSLTSYALSMISHALVDNVNLGTLDVSSNPLGLDEGHNNKALDDADPDSVPVPEDYSVTQVLDYLQSNMRKNKHQVRSLIRSARANGERFDQLIFSLAEATGVHVDKIEAIVFPAIMRKDLKEILNDLLLRTGLSSLAMRSCGLLDRHAQLIVQIINKTKLCNEREHAESNAMTILRDSSYYRSGAGLKLASLLREQGVVLSSGESDAGRNHHALAALDRMDLEQIAAFLKTKYRAMFLQSFQRQCCLQHLDLSDNHFGPTSANWIAAATGHYFLDDLQLSIGYRAPAILRKKQYDGGGHSHRVSVQGNGEDDDDDDEEDDDNLSSEGKQTGTFWQEPFQMLHEVKSLVSSGGRRVKKALFSSTRKNVEML